MVADTYKKVEEVLSQSKQSHAGVQCLRDGIYAVGNELNKIVPAKEKSQVQEFEEFLGCKIPEEVNIHPPNDIRSRGKIKRIKGHNEKGRKKGNQKKVKVSQVSKFKQINHGRGISEHA